MDIFYIMNNTETPFTNREARPDQKKIRSRSHLYLIGGIASAVLVMGIIFAVKGFSSDRYRTLELVNTHELLENHERLLGGKFKLLATVDVELGTEPGKGKLVAFRDSETQTIVPVMIATEELAERTLSKGQRYKMEVQVARGGILHANHLEKD